MGKLSVIPVPGGGTAEKRVAVYSKVETLPAGENTYAYLPAGTVEVPEGTRFIVLMSHGNVGGRDGPDIAEDDIPSLSLSGASIWFIVDLNGGAKWIYYVDRGDLISVGDQEVTFANGQLRWRSRKSSYRYGYGEISYGRITVCVDFYQ